MNPSSIQAIAAQEAAIKQRRMWLEAAFARRIRSMLEELEELESRRHALQEEEFRKFDADHGMTPAYLADAAEVAALEANRRIAA